MLRINYIPEDIKVGGFFNNFEEAEQFIENDMLSPDMMDYEIIDEHGDPVECETPNWEMNYLNLSTQ